MWVHDRSWTLSDYYADTANLTLNRWIRQIKYWQRKRNMWIIKIPVEWIVLFFRLSIKINAQLLALAAISLCAMHCLTHLWSVTKFIIDFFRWNTADKMILWWSRLFEFFFYFWYCYYKLRFFFFHLLFVVYCIRPVCF